MHVKRFIHPEFAWKGTWKIRKVVVCSNVHHCKRLSICWRHQLLMKIPNPGSGESLTRVSTWRRKCFPRLLGGAWVTIKDKTNGLLIVEIWWTDKCGSKKCLHKPGKTLLFCEFFASKTIGPSLETTSFYKKHISTGPGITSCRTCDCFKICVEFNGTICSWQRQRFDTWRSNLSS